MKTKPAGEAVNPNSFRKGDLSHVQIDNGESAEPVTEVADAAQVPDVQ